MDFNNPEHIKWFNDMPPNIQDLIRAYPEETYRIKKGAPYSLSCEGVIVKIVSYCANEWVVVEVLAKNKNKLCRTNERALCELNGTDYNEAKDKDIGVEIEPIWLEPVGENTESYD